MKAGRSCVFFSAAQIVYAYGKKQGLIFTFRYRCLLRDQRARSNPMKNLKISPLLIGAIFLMMVTATTKASACTFTREGHIPWSCITSKKRTANLDMKAVTEEDAGKMQCPEKISFWKRIDKNWQIFKVCVQDK